MSVPVQEAISNYNRLLDYSLEKMKKIRHKCACHPPEDLRKHYEDTWIIIDKKRIEINKDKAYINEYINNLETSKKSLSKMEKVIDEIGMILNEGRAGTLHGLCRELIKQNEIPMDEIEETVYNFPYDEKSEIEKDRNSLKRIDIKEVVKRVGGKKNNTKRRKYIAKNRNNKKSKKLKN